MSGTTSCSKGVGGGADASSPLGTSALWGLSHLHLLGSRGAWLLTASDEWGTSLSSGRVSPSPPVMSQMQGSYHTVQTVRVVGDIGPTSWAASIWGSLAQGFLTEVPLEVVTERALRNFGGTMGKRHSKEMEQPGQRYRAVRILSFVQKYLL